MVEKLREVLLNAWFISSACQFLLFTWYDFFIFCTMGFAAALFFKYRSGKLSFNGFWPEGI